MKVYYDDTEDHLKNDNLQVLHVIDVIGETRIDSKRPNIPDVRTICKFVEEHFIKIIIFCTKLLESLPQEWFMKGSVIRQLI